MVKEENTGKGGFSLLIMNDDSIYALNPESIEGQKGQKTKELRATKVAPTHMVAVTKKVILEYMLDFKKI